MPKLTEVVRLGIVLRPNRATTSHKNFSLGSGLPHMKQTDRKGVNAVERIFLEEFGWLFREQPISDWGIDAHVEVADKAKPSGRLLALQIKSGVSYFKERAGNWVFYGDYKHEHYWLNHSLPVILVLHDPDQKVTVWQRFDPGKVTKHEKSWSIEIPKTQILNAEAKAELERGVSDISAYRRLRLSFDQPLMREMKDRVTFLKVEEWVNKSLNFRRALVVFDDIENEPAHELNMGLPAPSINRFMAVVFPWLDFSYAEDTTQIHAGEFAEHRLRIQLNDLAKAQLLLADFYENGAVEGREETAYDWG